ncbi:unnamed protein product [Durusdinium trenchii]|uniref:Solute carrier family 40 protein n=1 Tax=Durusdinium trenchii TaxID=1381693 RepID=A0ABP0LHS7_9DINO
MERLPTVQLWPASSGHKQYFLTYFAQGLGRVGKEYLKSSASLALSMGELQLFSNLLPEFGSLPWALKPLFVLVIERTCSSRGQGLVLAAAAAVTSLAWLALAMLEVSSSTLLWATALLSVASALVDGLTDGRIAVESAESAESADAAAQLQRLCQTGHSLGALLVGFSAWLFSFSDCFTLAFTSLAWASIAPFALSASHTSRKVAKHSRPAPTTWWTPPTLVVSALSFAVCVAPPADLFLYRQHVLGLQNFHQPIVSIAGTVGWFTCTLLYRNISGVDRGAGGADAAHAPSVSALRRCLRWWPFPMLAKVFILLAPSTAFQLPLVLLESAAHEFGKALTFLPVTVLQQLHAVEGSEGSCFSLMQAAGTLGMVLGRNLEWQLLYICGVDLGHGAEGFRNFPALLLVALLWYVRNIPMSAVLDRGGLEQRWVAVYPPGDPLNLHFDPNQLPRDGSPQVCLSVAVHEDLLATVANLPTQSDSSAFSSFPRFSPEARLSEGVVASDKVDQLRRSISSLQAEMKLSQEREIERPSAGALGVAFARESLLPVAGGSHPGSRGPGSELVSADLAPWPSIAPAPGLDMVSSTSPARGAGVGVH